MKQLSVNLDGRGRLAVVVGGGTAGRRKVNALLACGARVRLVDPRGWRGEPPQGLEVLARAFRAEDLEGGWLVFAATDDPRVNQEVADAARRRQLPVCRADAPELGDFTLPAVRALGDLTLAVSTAGRSPALAAVAADWLQQQLGAGWPQLVELAAALRARQLTHQGQVPYNQQVLRQLVDGGVVGLLAAGRPGPVDALLQRVCGPGWTLAELDIQLEPGDS